MIGMSDNGITHASGRKLIIVLAECCADLIFTGLKKMPAPGQEEYGDGFYLRAGGGANTAFMLSRLGAPAAMLTNIGADFFGNFVSGSLRNAGVDLTFAKKTQRSSVTAVMVAEGERAFASFSGGGFNPTENEIESAVKEACIVHSYLYYSASFNLAEICAKNGAHLSLDAGWGFFPKGDELKKNLDGVWAFKLNRAEARELTGKEIPEEMLDVLSKYCPNVMITLGKEGAAAIMDGVYHKTPSPFVNAVDTTGSGDAFAAGWLGGHLEGLKGEALLKRACAAGALCATLIGGGDEGFSRAAVLNLEGKAES